MFLLAHTPLNDVRQVAVPPHPGIGTVPVEVIPQCSGDRGRQLGLTCQHFSCQYYRVVRRQVCLVVRLKRELLSTWRRCGPVTGVVHELGECWHCKDLRPTQMLLGFEGAEIGMFPCRAQAGPRWRRPTAADNGPTFGG